MGFILLARGERKLFFVTELLSHAVYLGLVWIGVLSFGLVGTGIAFFGLYVFHWALIQLIVHRLTGFGWSAANVRIGLIYGPLVAVTVAGAFWLPPLHGTMLGAATTLLAGLHSLRMFCTLVPMDRLPSSVRKLLTFAKLTAAKTNA
jgi:PST family polysaccharide transporter